MDALAYVQSDITQLATTFDVYTRVNDGAYEGDFQQDGTADVHVFNPSSQQQVVVEGSGEETSFTGLTNVQYDSNDDVVHDVDVNDQLRLDGKRYDVRVKEGVPSEHDPKFWRLGLDLANQSQ